MLGGRIAIITGAGSGMGRAAALVFARHGARVVVSDVNDQGGAKTVAMVEAAGGQAVYVHADVSSTKDAEGLARAAVERFGTIDVLYNNAAATQLCNEKDRMVHELEEWV